LKINVLRNQERKVKKNKFYLRGGVVFLVSKMKGMLLDRYGYRVNSSHQQYEFESAGPNGIITKIVIYQYMETVEYVDHYNLFFGDVNQLTGKLCDLSVTNHFSGCRIYARGSNPIRTRLYQMGIASHFDEINNHFLIRGEHPEKRWVPFRTGENYRAFLATRRINTIFN
jgi:hypothetical protein